MSTDIKRHALVGIVSIRIPPEPPIDSIVVFRKYFGKYKPFIYTALRTEIGWFVSSRSKEHKGCTWKKVIQLACLDEVVQPIMLIVTDFEQL